MKVVGLVGLLVAALGWLLEPQVFASAWLAGLVVWLGWPLGSLVLLLAHRLIGGQWGVTLIPGLAAGVRGLWLLVPAAIPLLLTTPLLYPWAHGGSGYLSAPFVAIRAILYLVIWLGLGAVTLRAIERGVVSAGLAVFGLVLLIVTMNFAALDMTLSLQPGIASEAYGLVAITGAVGLALAVAILTSGGGSGAGGLLLGVALLWIYLDFVQFLIIAESDLPTDAPWYVTHLTGGWMVVAITVSILHAAVPVLSLLTPGMRRSPVVLIAVSVLLIVGTVLRGWWTVLPAMPRSLSWIDFACLLAFVGASIALPARHAQAHHV